MIKKFNKNTKDNITTSPKTKNYIKASNYKNNNSLNLIDKSFIENSLNQTNTNKKPNEIKVIVDIRIEKNNLRQQYRAKKESLSPELKRQKDENIYNKLINFNLYKNAEGILIFVSTTIEIDTHRIICHALNSGKKVYVPKCLDKNGNMQFFLIKSFADLEKSTYGILEPKYKELEEISDYTNTICILPGFAFDLSGYRVGFGKGFYDRFLKNYTGIKIGICYNDCIIKKVPNGRFDIAAKYIVTEKYILTCTPKPSQKIQHNNNSDK